METFSIEKTLLINVPPSILFEALTNSDKIVQYYPLKEVVSDWEVGSEILGKGSYDNQDFIDYGKIDVLIPNQKFQYTYWSDNHGTERIPENYLTICYILFPNNERTILKLEHHNIKSEKMYSEMSNVWDFLLSSLKDFVEKNYSK